MKKRKQQASEAQLASLLIQDVDREKQESRDADARDLASGRKSREQLSHENSLFHGRQFRVHLKSGKRLW
jgi:hypothetical protein